jgi:sporulation protein YlmC with PRC-barrel domain
MSYLSKFEYCKMARAIGLALTLATAGSSVAAAQSGESASTSAAQSEIATRWSVPASRLIGMEVQNRQGEALGEVIDLIVDTSSEEVEYAILSFGGVMNLGDKLFAYPLEQFDRTGARDQDKLTLNVSAERLESAPGFDRSLWPDFDRSEYRDQIERYYGTLPASSDTRYVRVSQMLDGDVKDTGGNDIGDIHDVAIDMVSGSVHYVVLEFEDDWASRGELVAMPMQALRSEDADGTDLVYEASRTELSQAPAFERDRWPDIVGSDEFHLDFDRYHGSWTSADASS